MYIPRLPMWSLSWGGALILLVGGCGDDLQRTSFRMEVGKKYPLREWPDSNYVASLDSIAGLEQVRATGPAPAQLTLNPITGLPAPQIPPRPGSQAGKSSGTSGDPKPNPASNTDSSEAFLRDFIAALEELRLDPAGAPMAVLIAGDGDDISALLRRQYGQKAARIPRFVLLSQLQGLHPQVDLENLKAGDRIQLPLLR